jgi:hypothetical protein
MLLESQIESNHQVMLEELCGYFKVKEKKQQPLYLIP